MQTETRDFLSEHVKVVRVPIPSTTRTCPECGRVFDMFDETDAQEWHYGHDCEGE